MADTKISALTSATTPLAGTEVLPIVQSSTTKKVAVSDLTTGRTVDASAFTSQSGYTDTTNANTVSTLAGSRLTLQRNSYNDPPFLYFLGDTPCGFIEFARKTTVDSYPTSYAKIQVDQGAGDSRRTDMTFYTSDTGASTAQFKVGYDGNITALTGNFIQGTAAKGINFTANTPASGMTSQLLNWYEEGTWTPTIGGTATYTIQEGYYVRVGDLVYVQCQLLLNVIGTGSTTTIDGLPFQAYSSSNSSRGTGSVWYCGNLATNVTSLVPGVTPAGQTITFGGFTAAGTSMSVPLTLFQNGTRVDFSLTYRTN